MRKNIALVLSITTFLLLASCGKRSTDPLLLGKWEKDGQQYSFNKDGTMTINSVRYSYRIDDGTLYISAKNKNKAFAYNIIGDSLFIASNEYNRYIEPEKNTNEITDYIRKFFS